MARFSRILLTDDNNNNNSSSSKSSAPPPEAVALESDFVIILAVLLCALICVVGLIAAARCAWRRRGGNNRRAIANRHPSPPNKGLKKKVLQSFPKFTYTTATAQEANYSDGSSSSSSTCVKLTPLSSECAICLGEFEEGDELRVLPQCGHGFHVACIDKWLGSHTSCPSCRQILAVGRCQKCGQFPSVSLPSASASTSAAVRDNNEAELNSSENRVSTANNAATFFP